MSTRMETHRRALIHLSCICSDPASYHVRAVRKHSGESKLLCPCFATFIDSERTRCSNITHLNGVWAWLVRPRSIADACLVGMRGLEVKVKVESPQCQTLVAQTCLSNAQGTHSFPTNALVPFFSCKSGMLGRSRPEDTCTRSQISITQRP